MRFDANDDVFDVLDRVDADCVACSHQRVEAGEIRATLLVTDEEEVLPAECDDAEGSFACVVVDGDAHILRKAVSVFHWFRA